MDSTKKYLIAEAMIKNIKRRIYDLKNCATGSLTGIFEFEEDAAKEIHELEQALIYWQQFLLNVDSWGYEADPFK